MPPENVRCAPLTSQSLQISWQPPPSHHTNGLLQGYKVNFEFMSDLISGMNDDIDSRKTTDLTIVLTGLKKFTNYSIQALAFTRIGDGVVSKPLYCQTEEDGKFNFSYSHFHSCSKNIKRKINTQLQFNEIRSLCSTGSASRYQSCC